MSSNSIDFSLNTNRPVSYKFNSFTDRIPIASTVTSVAIILLKLTVIPFCSDVQINRYSLLAHSKEVSLLRTLCLTLPIIGNTIIYYIDKNKLSDVQRNDIKTAANEKRTTTERLKALNAIERSIPSQKTLSVYGHTVSVEDCKVMKRKLCLERLNIDLSNPIAWSELGYTLNNEESILVDGVNRTKKECLTRALEIDPTDSKLWKEAGSMLDTEERIVVKGVSFTRLTCYAKSLELDPTNSKLWEEAGLMLCKVGVIAVKGKKFTKLECYAKALELDPYNSILQSDVHTLVGDGSFLEKTRLNKWQCYAKALELDPYNSELWEKVGSLLTRGELIVVKEKCFSKQECYAKSLELNPNNLTLWATLTSILLHTWIDLKSMGDSLARSSCEYDWVYINKTCITWKECLHKLLDSSYDPDDKRRAISLVFANASAYLIEKLTYTDMPKTLDSLLVTVDDLMRLNGLFLEPCLITALKLYPNNSKYWLALSFLLSNTSTIIVEGKPFTKQQCQIRALELDPSLKLAWKALSHSRPKGFSRLFKSGSIKVGKEVLTWDECLRRSL